jgi:uncharacterized membrane protein YcaP (DUF421 family)
MEIISTLVGHGKDLNTLQMCVRAILVFLITLLLIRISGRRSFGMGSAFDNIIVILLGAILGRTVVGASEFIPTISAAFVTVILHRFFGWLGIANHKIGALLKGDKIILFENGKLIPANLKRALLTEQDLRASLRKSLHTTTFDDIECAYMECNGEISFIEKQNPE